MQAKSILIIEDDKPIRDMMKSLLEIEGYFITTASNGKEGIEELKKNPEFAVILLDMMMPVMNGWDFLDFLRSNAQTSQIPVVIVSAYGEIAKSVRPHAIVPKPVQLKSLIKAVEAFAA